MLYLKHQAIIFAFTLLISVNKSLLPYSNLHSNHRVKIASYSSNYDLFNNNGIKKTIIQPSRSQLKDKFPGLNDVVEITFKIFRSDGSIAYSSYDNDISEVNLMNSETGNDKIFDFKIGQKPSEVIPGWEIAIQSMLVDEISKFYIPSEYAFGSTGLPPPISIQPNEDIYTEIHLLRIIPALSKRYKAVGSNENIREELVEKIEKNKESYMNEIDRQRDRDMKEKKKESEKNKINKFNDVILSSTTATQNSNPASTKMSENSSNNINVNNKFGENSESNKNFKNARFFNSQNDRIDPNQRVAGRGAGHSWDESKHTIDIKIPILIPKYISEQPRTMKVQNKWNNLNIINPIKKSDINIDITSQFINISSTHMSSGSNSILNGPLFGKIVASESTWAIINPADNTNSYIPTNSGKSDVDVDIIIEDEIYQKVPYVLLSLIKGYGHQDIWASVFSKEHTDSLVSKQFDFESDPEYKKSIPFNFDNNNISDHFE